MEGIHLKSTELLARMATQGLRTCLILKINVKRIRNQQSMTKITLYYKLCFLLHFQNALHLGQPPVWETLCCFSTPLLCPPIPPRTGTFLWHLPQVPYIRIQPTPAFCCLKDVLKDRILASCWQETQHAAPISRPES